MQGPRGVPLTGQTLASALKLRCDTTGAAYAIFWSKIGTEFKPTGSHVANSAVAGYVEASKKLVLDATGNGPVAEVKRNLEPRFVKNVVESTMLRKELAFQNGVTQTVLMPFEDGVIEFGNYRTKEQWETIESIHMVTVPKAPLRKAFEDLGALYTILWEETGDELRVVGDYENPRDKTLRLSLRGDGKSFNSISRELVLSSTGAGPVAEALRREDEVVITFDEKADNSMCSTMKRAGAAVEFGITEVHFVPFTDPNTGVRAVLEYGVSSQTELNEVTLDAMLKLQAEVSGAGYAIYWKYNGEKATHTKSFVTAGYKAELKAAGKTVSFAEASEAIDYELVGDFPVSKVMRDRQAIYIQDMSTCPLDLERAEVAKAYLVESAAFVPVLGGVIEYGTTLGAERHWTQPEDALKQIMPNEEIENAFTKGGATYGIFWKRDDKSGFYTQKGTYERPDNLLSKAQVEGGESYLSKSGELTMMVNGMGPIAIAGSANTIINIPDTQNFAGFKRKELAAEWGVGKCVFVPLETGVLEYGTVTKDKRGTTFGSEYQETVRQYRRTVFMHDDWVEHRSTDRFFRSLMTIGESGVVRSRGQELGIIAGFGAFLVAWNSIAGGYTDFSNVAHDPLLPHLPVLALPFSIFSLTSGSLGLLLVFRTNAAYARWDDARKVWGSIINNCRSLVRQGNTFFTEDRYPGYGNYRDYRRRVAAETSAFTRCLRCFLRGKSDEPKLAVELKALGFTPAEVAGYLGATNRQVYALQRLAETIRQYGMDGRDRERMDATLSVLTDNVGACERIFKSPVPLVYTRHTSRFAGVWLALLPLAMWANDPSWNHLASIPSAVVVAFFLLGTEELGLQIEEPFGILPMEAFCEGSIGAVLNEMVLAEDKTRAQERDFHALREVELMANLELEAKASAQEEPVAASQAAPVEAAPVEVALPEAGGVVIPSAQPQADEEEKSGGFKEDLKSFFSSSKN